MFFFVIAFVLVVLDMVSKFLTTTYLKPLHSVEVIKNFFSLTYVENRGAAFGILQNARWVFIVATAIAIVAMIYYKFKYKPQGKVINTSLCLILSGAVGNMIDRLRLGYVVDMLEVTFIDYPVFNVADCFVVIGAILLMIYIVFIYKEPENKDD